MLKIAGWLFNEGANLLKCLWKAYAADDIAGISIFLDNNILMAIATLLNKIAGWSYET